jgi:hypothetical protein
MTEKAWETRPRIVALACVEMKVIGKPYAQELQVGSLGGNSFISGKILHGHEIGTADTSKDRPNEH